MRASKYFNIAEFDCHDGTPVPDYYKGNIIKLAEQLDVIRNELKTPIIILSGYRTTRYNEKVGGAINSKHISCEAADIRTAHHTAYEIYDCILFLINARKLKDGGVGIYDTWVHYDIGKARRWDNRTK